MEKMIGIRLAEARVLGRRRGEISSIATQDTPRRHFVAVAIAGGLMLACAVLAAGIGW